MSEKTALQPRVSRRDFLKLSAGTAGAAALGTMLDIFRRPRSASAAGPEPGRETPKTNEQLSREEYQQRAMLAVGILNTFLATREQVKPSEQPFSAFLKEQLAQDERITDWKTEKYINLLETHVDLLLREVHGTRRGSGYESGSVTTSPQALVAMLSVLLHHQPDGPAYPIHDTENMTAAGMLNGDPNILNQFSNQGISKNSSIRDFLDVYNQLDKNTTYSRQLATTNMGDKEIKSKWFVEKLQYTLDGLGNRQSVHFSSETVQKRQELRPGTIFILPEKDSQSQAFAGVIIGVEPDDKNPTKITFAHITGDNLHQISKPKVETLSFSDFAIRLTQTDTNQNSRSGQVVFITHATDAELLPTQDRDVIQPPHWDRRESLPKSIDQAMDGMEQFFARAANMAEKISKHFTGRV